MSLKHLIGHLAPAKITFQPYVVLHPVSGICSSQGMNWSKCRSMTAAFERQTFAKPTGQTELASHAPPGPQPARENPTGGNNQLNHHPPRRRTWFQKPKLLKSRLPLLFCSCCLARAVGIFKHRGMHSVGSVVACATRCGSLPSQPSDQCSSQQTGQQSPKSPAAATRQHDHGGRPMKPKNEKRKAGSKQAALQDLASIE